VRILLYAPNYLPATRYGGPVRSAHGLARGLVELGHEVSVLTTNVDGPARLEVSLDGPVELDRVRVYYSPVITPHRLYYSPMLARLAGALVPDMDVVHVNGMFLWPGPYLSRAARRSGKTLVISPRGMLSPEMIAGKSRFLKTAWIRLQERANLNAANAIHVTSEGEAEGLRQMGLDLAPVVAIGNGVDAPGHTPSPLDIKAIWGDIPPGRRVAFLGRLDWTKGVDLAIDAVKQHPDAMLLIAGHDQIGLRAQLEPRLRRTNGTVCGSFVGPLDGMAKWALLAGADVLLAPSVSESFGMSVAEALAVGTPAIVAPGVGAGAILQRIDGRLIAQRDADAVAVALSSLLGDEARRSAIGEAARVVMKEDYSWRGIAAAMAKLYERSTRIERA
jgi:glycosyltransferase involved in cell wall biosynthesis